LAKFGHRFFWPAFFSPAPFEVLRSRPLINTGLDSDAALITNTVKSCIIVWSVHIVSLTLAVSTGNKVVGKRDIKIFKKYR
jgi:hypothetical protein